MKGKFCFSLISKKKSFKQSEDESLSSKNDSAFPRWTICLLQATDDVWRRLEFTNQSFSCQMRSRDKKLPFNFLNISFASTQGSAKRLNINFHYFLTGSPSSTANVQGFRKHFISHILNIALHISRQSLTTFRNCRLTF